MDVVSHVLTLKQNEFTTKARRAPSRTGPGTVMGFVGSISSGADVAVRIGAGLRKSALVSLVSWCFLSFF
jgi:uncharacterized protein YraI